ncbi:hypothetical protein [Natrarchaeobaculum aegyptiacum]|uniref:PadR family transcriptional regulator n=1 Tax=Natrarchaeobaculum aegyptiacum TaxID=745377 RepID=A0A2Z2HWZ1_9EURY|nr:hypothetical protein [Natrarchaeobaculum aegyptiacum]ARS90147.1 hypothetical protein B1756_10670 [Natrarchaeobaculum aegyptiacum]
MATDSIGDSLSVTEQVVLLGVVSVHRSGELPVQTHDLRGACRRLVDDLEADLVGTPTEADVMRALYRLEDEGVVEEVEEGSTSPTGKGRPAYRLGREPEAVLEAVDDDLVEGALE